MNGNRVNGSYTIEAAVIMSVFMVIFTGILYEAFYLHDRNVYMNTAVRYIAVLGRMSEEPVSDKGELVFEKLGGRDFFTEKTYILPEEADSFTGIIRSEAEKRAFASVTDQFNVDIRSSEITISYAGHTRFPGDLLLRYILADAGVFQGEWKYRRPVLPEAYIRAKKGIFGGE